MKTKAYKDLLIFTIFYRSTQIGLLLAAASTSWPIQVWVKPRCAVMELSQWINALTLTLLTLTV